MYFVTTTANFAMCGLDLIGAVHAFDDAKYIANYYASKHTGLGTAADDALAANVKVRDHAQLEFDPRDLEPGNGEVTLDSRTALAAAEQAVTAAKLRAVLDAIRATRSETGQVNFTHAAHSLGMPLRSFRRYLAENREEINADAKATGWFTVRGPRVGPAE